MTRHDDSYDALKASFGADLREAETRHRASRANSARRPIRLGRLALVAATAAVALTVGALVLSGGPAERLNVVAQAQAALAPRPGIQHVRVRIEAKYELDGEPMEFPPGQGPLDGPTLVEQWAAAEPGRRHSITTEPGLRPGEPERVSEQSYVAGPRGKRDDVAKYHWGIENRSEIITRLPKSHRDDPSALMWGPNGDERLENLPTMLASGRLKDRGAATVNGRQTRRLVGRRASPGAAPLRFDYFVDANTFAPVRIVQRWRTKIDPEIGRMHTITVRVDFLLYEHLPATPENEALLDFDLAGRGAPVTSRRYQENPRDATKRHERDGFDPDEIAAARGVELTK